ncbi:MULTISPECIES: NACHT domain-containing protein [unclassified Saccharothrix]|uniref:NACHT domain-containing protein n=1 Tax=unclassified Saccharothrix TaxID=2593673 RepID=UPI00307DF591
MVAAAEPPSDLPERYQRGRYLYERLEEKGFQRLCSALLAHVFPDVTCMPVGQADGGRDAVRPHPDGGTIVYQVKWSATPERDPVAWLTTAIRGEADNIRALVARGAKRYILLTSVAGTGPLDRGTMDRLDKLLVGFSTEFGVDMACWWRADLDARVDAAPESLRWAFADMLAGWDLIRYMLQAPEREVRELKLRDLLMKVVAAQWDEDAKVKFKQVDLNSHALADLYVDVRAARVKLPRWKPAGAKAIGFPPGHTAPLGGAAEYLLQAEHPLTVVLGAPGQGKSTLAQFVCQRHRAVLLGRGEAGDVAQDQVRVPLKVELRDYASWLGGDNPFDLSTPPVRRSVRSLEAFLADLLRARSGGRQVDVETVHDLIDRFPLLLVLDGLDEVADSAVRATVVDQIEKLRARLSTNNWTPRVVVTTRPNSSNLAEPSTDHFEHVVLLPLDAEIRNAYLRKWAAALELSPADEQSLASIFERRAMEPHIAQLAENPMQLTILLYLILKRGDSIPQARTELYRSFMETFLDREAAKSASVHRHRRDLEEVTAYLGWHLQSIAETERSNGTLPIREIKLAILEYLYTADKNVELVEELFTAVTDRVWALTSKEQGAFQFDVQPVQEYFAAKHLYEVAGADQRYFDASEVFRELLRRPYWSNTCRFYAGFAAVNELAALAEVLAEEFERLSPQPVPPPDDPNGPPTVQIPGVGRIAHTRTLTWALLRDGAFAARPRTQAAVARLFADDLSVHMLLSDARELGPLPHNRGAGALAQALLNRVEREPLHPMSVLRMQLVAHNATSDRDLYTGQFDDWWQPRMAEAVGTADEATWLRLGMALRAGERLPDDITERLSLADTAAAQYAISAGVTPLPGSPGDRRLLRAVLDGHCVWDDPAGRSYAADLLRLTRFEHFTGTGAPEHYIGGPATGHFAWPVSNLTREAAARLVGVDPRYSTVVTVPDGHPATLAPAGSWAAVSTTIREIHGGCLLADAVAAIGISTEVELDTESDLVSDDFAAGIAHNRTRPAWWRRQFPDSTEPVALARWTLTLLLAAPESIVFECVDLVEKALLDLPHAGRRALLSMSSALARYELAEPLSRSILGSVRVLAAPTAALLLHHTAKVDALDPLDEVYPQTLRHVLDADPYCWPVERAIHARMHTQPTEVLSAALRQVGPLVWFGPSDGAQVELPPGLVQAILCEAAEYPEYWVTLAESLHSAATKETPLAEVARTGRWFAVGR